MARTTKKAVRKAAAPARAAKSKAPRRKAGKFRARIRMYRQGLGDCFLVTLPRTNGAYHMLIDCGLFLGSPDQDAKMRAVVADVAKECGGQLDLLVATHEHWDHLSGFVQAADGFAKIAVAETWLGWTENPADPVAKKLGVQRQQMVAALRDASSGMRARAAGLAPASAEAVERGADEIDGLLGFFGAAGSTRDALEKVRRMGPKPRYCRPSDDPVAIDGTGARLFVLGPPEDLKLLKRHAPSKREPETYGLVAFDHFLGAMAPALAAGETVPPFAAHYAIPVANARGMAFFDRHYFAEASDDADGRQGWRRVDATWLDLPAEMALKLDSATNNTSLVLAVELGSGDVLLFAGDAQVGNWLSWQDLEWKVGGRTATGPDLLRRTVLYKVGHHGSHNATLREKGLEMMESLAWAMIPVDEAFARDVKGWKAMPLDDIVARLKQVTKANAGAVLRVDQRAPGGFAGTVVSTPLYHELTL